MLTPLSVPADLADRVYEALLDAICTGRWIAGERLTQESVADQLGVSRQPVLQAFRVLQRQGLLVDTPNKKGMLVAPLDADFLLQLYAVRGALDALAAQAAARTPRPELRAAGQALVRAGRAAARGGDIAALMDADLAFHRFVYDASDNPLLGRTAAVHWHHTRRAMAAYLRLPASFHHVWDEHEQMLEAIVAGDAAQAERLSREHASAAAGLLASQLAESAPPPPQARSPLPARSA